MTKEEERFEVVFKDGSQLKDEGFRLILVDKETGVNYKVNMRKFERPTDREGLALKS